MLRLRAAAGGSTQLSACNGVDRTAPVRPPAILSLIRLRAGGLGCRRPVPALWPAGDAARSVAPARQHGRAQPQSRVNRITSPTLGRVPRQSPLTQTDVPGVTLGTSHAYALARCISHCRAEPRRALAQQWEDLEDRGDRKKQCLTDHCPCPFGPLGAPRTGRRGRARRPRSAVPARPRPIADRYPRRGHPCGIAGHGASHRFASP
jgi:hypothetical protein